MRGVCWLDVGCGALLVACSATADPRTGVVAGAAAAAARADHGLPVDAYPVGFQSSWELDTTRTYRTAFDDGATYGGGESAPRPVLMNVWYPARTSAAEPMPHGGYLELPADDARLARLAAALSAFERGVLAAELLRKDEYELTPEDHALLEECLRAPTGCVRGAPPADGPFPLVVYHAGAGSSFEDNAELCEDLARHGIVVVGSAFPKADGTHFGIDGRAGSARDMGFLVERASELPFVDGTRVALVGHSAGAQAILRHAGERDCPADALVLLDTTLDYYALGFPLQAELVAAVTENAANVDQPMLVVAGPGGQFQLCDRLVGSERTYLSVPDLDHNEHISQGHQKNELDLLSGRTADGEPPDAERIRVVRARYERECADVRLFLDAVLRDRPAEFEKRTAELERNVPGGGEPWVERAPRGTAGPPPWDPASDRPPTARQLGPLLASAGAAGTCEILARFREREPQSPIYDSTMAWGSLLFVLIDGGREDEARTLYGCLRPLMPRLLGLFTFASDILRARDPEDARRILRAALLLEPEDEELLRRAAELER
jgi:hypothetical protein